MTYFKNIQNKLLITLDDDGRRTVLSNGMTFTAPVWYRPAFEPIEQITEDEYRYIAASGDWQEPTPTRNDASMYNDWD